MSRALHGADPDLAAAYAECEAITRREARNFSYGIRLLPPPRRAALSAVYALARRIDDIGDDGTRDLPAKQAALAALRESLHQPADPADPVLVAVADAARRYPVPMGAFDELVDGVEADARMDAEHVRTGLPARPHATFDDMVVYCRQVAGSVGRLCLGVFGSRPAAELAHEPAAELAHEPAAEPAHEPAAEPGVAPAAELADRLGIALQQTNILRDIREDLGNGRVYLPTEELARFGAELALDERGVLADPGGDLAAYIRFAADRAQTWYAEGLRLLPLLDRRSAACTAAMAEIYRRLLVEIAADPPSVYGQRRSLPTRQKLVVAVQSLLGRSPATPGAP